MKPDGARYEFDGCETCRFVGQMGPEDVWYCSRTDTLMRRWSDEPSEYLSMTPIAIGTMPALYGNSHMWGVAGMMAGVWTYPGDKRLVP